MGGDLGGGDGGGGDGGGDEGGAMGGVGGGETQGAQVGYLIPTADAASSYERPSICFWKRMAARLVSVLVAGRS